MRPLAQSERHNAPRLVYELVPGIKTVFEDLVVGLEDAVGQPALAHELPEVFDGVELGRLGRER